MNPRADFWAGKLVSVTGGTGFLGYQIVAQLLRLGARVRVIALPPRRPHPILDQSAVERIFADVCQASAVRRAVAGCDVVIHTAGTVAVWGPAVDRVFPVHLDGTRLVLECAPPHATIVHTSSVVAVGATRSGGSLDERSPFNLQHLKVPYVHAKRAAEELAVEAASAGRRVVVVNPGYLVGPEDYEESVMGRFCCRFWKGRILLAPRGGLNLVDVRDVATGHLLAAEHGQAGERYILGGENCRLRDLLGMLAAVAGMRPRGTPVMPAWLAAAVAAAAEFRGWRSAREPYPSFQQFRLGRYDWFYDSTRARTELGFKPRPLLESLADAYHWHTARRSLRLRGFNRLWMRPAEDSDVAAAA